MIENYPGMYADLVKTPTMLLFAAHNGPRGPYNMNFPPIQFNGIPFYNSLRRFDVPAALLAYDEPHVFQKPAAIADSMTRTGEWLDYWVQGRPFPDATRAQEYGEGEWGRGKGKRDAAGLTEVLSHSRSPQSKPVASNGQDRHQ